MLPTIIEELKKRQAYGNLMAQELIERLEAHGRDLMTTIAWIRENAKAESDAIDMLLGEAPVAAGQPDDASRDTFRTESQEVEEKPTSSPPAVRDDLTDDSRGP